tara:strand:+ start:332 stop:505 length:174 start_codon:yes stop_codon:yes gene_type:complete
MNNEEVKERIKGIIKKVNLMSEKIRLLEEYIDGKSFLQDGKIVKLSKLTKPIRRNMN